MQTVVAVMARYPYGTAVKTRLGPRLDARSRAALYDAFLRDTLLHVREVPQVARALLFTPDCERPFFDALAGPDVRLVPQRGEELGARIRAAFEALFEDYAHVLLIGSDAPDLPSEYLGRAARALERGAEVAIGPADDGGFYCVGLGRPAPSLFDGVPWSTAETLAHTLRRAEALQLRVELLPSWSDVDEPADLDRLARRLGQRSAGAPAPHTAAALRALSSDQRA